MKEAEDRNHKYENFYIPKLQETKKFQKQIYEELERIRLDADLLPSMFREEARYSSQLKAERDSAVKDMTAAMKQHNKLVSDLTDRTNEVKRKERMSVMAMAARSNMKQYLDEAKGEIGKLNQNISDL